MLALAAGGGVLGHAIRLARRAAKRRGDGPALVGQSGSALAMTTRSGGAASPRSSATWAMR
ncbi:MAG: hypothetical protein IPH95_09675 [Candidatus Promineofilum sp.]|nr:hypothetical protein [Promineifilum sp.]